MPPDAVRKGDSLQVQIPSVLRERDGVHRNHSLQAAPVRPKIRPLPRPPIPNDTLTPSARALPRRRASGGCFVNRATVPPPPRTYGFYVCNPSDSPTSPDPPQLPPYSLTAQSTLPINIIPATPMSPPTPGIYQSHANLAPPVPLDPDRPDVSSSEPSSHIRTVKRHRRFGGSVVPASVLAELRGMGEGNAPSRIVTLPIYSAETDSDNSSSEDDTEDLDDEELEEDYSWVVETATRGVRHRRASNSFSWVKDLGGDRWIADRYSSLLRAL
ncbi:hypothetical protein B0H11DRAFT_2241597 [Mycena galericulata]|nr:hypothetical protein B0H11DRAFT_2241597 [Mycena galericulata]